MKTPANGTPTTIVITKRDGTITAIIPAYWYNGLKVTVP